MWGKDRANSDVSYTGILPVHIGTGCMTCIPQVIQHGDMIVAITSDVLKSIGWKDHEQLTVDTLHDQVQQ